MPSIKALGIGMALATGAVGVATAVHYSKDIFSSNTQISELLEQENKYSLLPTQSLDYNEEWDEAWGRYTKNGEDTSDKWKVPTEDGVIATKAPIGFKNICKQKATEKVNSKTDQRYIDITNYCSRPKKLSEVLSKESISLLSTTNKEQEWKTKFNSYKTSNNQIPEVFIQSNEEAEKDFNKLRKGCEKALTTKTTDKNYQKIYDAVKVWCKE